MMAAGQRVWRSAVLPQCVIPVRRIRFAGYEPFRVHSLVKSIRPIERLGIGPQNDNFDFFGGLLDFACRSRRKNLTFVEPEEQR